MCGEQRTSTSCTVTRLWGPVAVLHFDNIHALFSQHSSDLSLRKHLYPVQAIQLEQDCTPNLAHENTIRLLCSCGLIFASAIRNETFFFPAGMAKPKSLLRMKTNRKHKAKRKKNKTKLTTTKKESSLRLEILLCLKAVNFLIIRISPFSLGLIALCFFYL